MLRLTVETTVPETRRVLIDLPPDTPVGPIRLTIEEQPEDTVVEFVVPEIDVSRLPTYIDPQTGERCLVGRSGVVREVWNGQ